MDAMSQSPEDHRFRCPAADAALAVGDVDGAVAHLSATIRDLTASGDNRGAAMACGRLGFLYAVALGNKVAARPWFARAVRLLEDEAPCVEQGWVAVAAMGCEVDDPDVLLGHAELALDRARRFGDLHLEVKALADGGLAHVEAGRVDEGMAMIDEAMALACGGSAHDLEIVGQSVCSFYTACYLTRDLARVEAWSPILRQRGMLENIPGPAALLRSHCDSVQGTLLCDLGRLGEAETVLERALAAIEQVMPVPAASMHPTTALADLRILQGRLAEAEALLLGRDDVMEALLPTARLRLAQRDYELAAATARRGLALVGDDRVRAAALLTVLVEAQLGRGRIPEAAAASADLDARTRALGLPALEAEAARVRALVRTAQQDFDGAVASLLEGLQRLAGVDLPRLKASLHLALVRVHDATGDQASAIVEARAAGAALARIDAPCRAAEATLLRRFGVDVICAGASRGRVVILQPGSPWWTVTDGDTTVRIRGTKGLRYLAELVAHRGAERHALDLVDLVEGAALAGDVDRHAIGDAGALLDTKARAAYRRQIEALRNEVEDALAVEDDDRAAKAQVELDAFVAELARAVGLGGRDRRAASAAEKARLNVTRALRGAAARLTEALPEAGAALDRSLRTGLFCAYEPPSGEEIVWSVQSPLNGNAPR
jgi:tetratricopeptide (TPR) repeat protein